MSPFYVATSYIMLSCYCAVLFSLGNRCPCGIILLVKRARLTADH